MEIILILGTIGGLAFLIFLLLMPRLFTLIAIFFTLFQLNWFVRYYSVPPMANRATIVIVGFLSIRIIIHLLLKKVTIRTDNGQMVPLIFLASFIIMLTIISGLYNEESLVIGFYSLRYYFVGLTLTFALFMYCNNYLSIETFKRNMVWLALIQTPVAILKYLAAGGGGLSTLDSVSGTFSGYGELVISQVVAIGIVLTDKFIKRTNTLPRINAYILLVFIITPLLLSKSRTATLFVLAIVLYVLIYSLFKRRNLVSALKLISLSGFICLTFASLFYIFFWQAGDYQIDEQFNPEYVLEYYMREPISDRKRLSRGADPSMGRLRAIYTSWHLIQLDTIHSILGYGAGSGSEASFLGLEGTYFQVSGPLSGVDRNQYSKTILEFGMLGLLGIIYFYYMIGKRLKYATDRANELSIVYSVLMVVLMIISFYTITIESFLFAFIIAYFIAVSHSEILRNQR